MPTCIIATHCSDGTIMVADRRETNGFEAFDEDKVFALPERNPVVITGFSGITGVRDKFIPLVANALRETRRKEEITELEFLIWPIEETVKSLKDRYKERLEGTSRTPIIHALVMGKERVESGSQKIYRLFEEGFAEECRETACTGSAGHYASLLLRLLNPRPKQRSMEEMLKITSHIILLVEGTGIDMNVGGSPQGGIIDSKGKLQILSEAEMSKHIGPAKPDQLAQQAKKAFSSLFTAPGSP